MRDKHPVFDDIAGLMTGAMGLARAAGDEARAVGQSRIHALIADMDLASREEVETLKAIALQALERVDALEKRIEKLEK